jgi:subtilase family serine protease
LLQNGGTSAAAPTVAATVALVQQFELCCGARRPLADFPGFLYSPAGYGDWLTPITQGSNGRYDAQPATAANPMAYSNVAGLGVPCLLRFPEPCTNGR